MNYQQTAQLLNLASANDNRVVTDAAMKLWFEILGDLDYDAAVSAMYAHFRESTDYLMPAHIVTRVRQAHQAELPGTMSPPIPDTCPDGEHHWVSDGTCSLCLTRAEDDPHTASGRGGGAPKPDNFAAMVAAAKDPVRWAAEVAKYNQQLARIGLAPVSARLPRPGHRV